MAISRSLMNRQLQANGGIMQVAPREKFGLGSSLKKFVRKIIPNEVADIAVKAAPFVAPFNPAVAAAMSGLGTFDQTGSIGDSLKRGALTYGGGQAARYIGGADFQGNPFGDGGAFTGGLQGFKGGFSSPIGKETGLGKFFSNRGTAAKEGIQGIDMATGGADGVGVIQDAPTTTLANANELSYVPEASIDMVTGGADGVGIIQDTVSENMLLPKAKPIISGSPNQMTITDSIKQIVSPNSTMGDRGTAALDLLKRTGKAAFTKEGKNGPVLDKAAVLGTIAFAGSYAEARALAAETGIDPDLTEAEYDQLAKAEKKEEYASYLTNFFGGKKDGGRIGYEGGANELIMEKLTEDIVPDTSTEEMIMIMTEDGPKMVKKSDLEAMPGMFRDTTTSLYGDAARGRPVPEFANGGRIGLKFGSEPEDAEVGIMTIDVEAGNDDEEENDLMAGITFSSAEKSYLFKRLGGAGGSDRSYTMPQLYRVLSNPDRYAEDAAVLKEIAIMGLGKKDGGRIGFAFGSPDRKTDIEEELSVDTIYRPNADFNKNIELEEESSITLPDNTMMAGKNRVGELLFIRSERMAKDEDYSDIDAELRSLGYFMKAEGGIMNAKMPTGQMRKNNAGVVERDYRDEGGFVPVGIKERADDVPAMLSKNEFVMTADAVRGIGNGSVEEGSKKLYNTMKQAEKVGKA